MYDSNIFHENYLIKISKLHNKHKTTSNLLHLKRLYVIHVHLNDIFIHAKLSWNI